MVVVTRKPSIAVIVLGKSDTEIEQFSERSPHAAEEARLVMVSNPGKRHGGYATIANPFFAEAPEDVVGIVHADTSFAPGTLEGFAGSAMDGDIVGIVGRSIGGQYVWGRAGGGVVSTLDSCSVFFAKRYDLRFDGVVFDDFHCCVEDLCLQASARGITSRVPHLVADHIGVLDRPPEWMPNYARYREALVRKWIHVPFMTT